MQKSGNTVLITGGASGIGLALAKMFSENDNQVIIVGRNREKLAHVHQMNNALKTLQADISHQEDLEKLVLEVQNQYPAVNVLINNAALQYNYYLTDEPIPYQRIDQEIAVNFNAVVKLSAMLLPVLGAHKNAAIVTVSSALAFAPKENAAVYCATKAAVHNFTTVLRYQLDKSAVRVFELIPPLVNTSMTAGRGSDKLEPEQVAEAFKEAWVKNIYEINVGKVKLVRGLLRWFPGLITKKLRYSI